MAKFLTDLIINQLTDSVFELVEPLIYQSDILGGFKVEAPGGFQSDGASVPRVPIAYMLYGNRAHREAVIHDYLYRADSIPEVAFKTANETFLEAMKCRGKPWYVRRSMYIGVCVGGYPSYHKRKVGDSLV